MRRLACVSFVTLALAACGPQHSMPAAAPVAGVCSSSSLSSCEHNLREALQKAEDTTAALQAYMTARAGSLGNQDAWVQLWNEAKNASGKVLVFAGEGSSRAADVVKAVGGVQAKVSTAALPPLQGLEPQQLLVAMARAASVPHIVWLHQNSATHALGSDRLAPLLYELPASYTDQYPANDSDLPHKVARAVALDQLIEQAMERLADDDYQRAAELTEQASISLRQVPPESAAGLRARYFVGRAYLFGGGPAVDEAKQGQSRTNDPDDTTRAAQADGAGQGPYAAWLRVLLEPDDTAAAWSKRRETLREALSQERFQVLDDLYAYAPGGASARCEASRRPIGKAAWQGQPFFVHRLAYEARAGLLGTTDWARAYEAIVRTTEAKGLGWYALGGLLAQRGDLPGLTVTDSALYKRVTQLAVRHIAALHKFQATAPKLYQPGGQLTIALLPGAASDPQITNYLQGLLAANVKHELASSNDPGDLFESSIVLLSVGMALPPATRAAYLQSLYEQFDQQLRTGMADKTGWQVAALYGLGALGAQMLGSGPDWAYFGDQVRRALESPNHIAMRPVAQLASRSVQYAALMADDALETDKVGAAAVGPRRSAARRGLSDSLKAMAEPGEQVPAAALGHLTTLVDGMIATAWLMSREDKDSSAGRCAQHKPMRPEVKRNVRALETARDALLPDRAIAQPNTAWARRAALLTVLLSDVLDVMRADSNQKPSFKVAEQQARVAVQNGLSDWVDPELARGLSAVHLLARKLASEQGEWKDIVAARPDEVADAMKVASSLLGASDSAGLGRFALLASSKVLAGAPRSGDAAPVLQYARELYAQQRQDQATIAMVLAGILSAGHGEADQAIALAREKKSPAAWLVAVRHAVQQASATEPLHAAALEQGLREMTDDACKSADVQPLITVGHAVERFSRGQRDAATASLDSVLDAAEKNGLAVPRVQYQFDDMLASGRVLRISAHMTGGQGFISENSLSLSIDFYSSKPSPGLKVQILEPVAEDAGRYYTHVAATAALYHFLQQRDAPAVYNAERAINALTYGSVLGDDRVAGASKWLDDSGDTLAMVAQAALQRQQPLLAGTILRLLRDNMDPQAERTPRTGRDDDEIPISYRSIPGLEAMKQAAAETDAILARSVSCEASNQPAKVEAADCDEYRRGIALWHAGAIAQAPSLKKGQTCPLEGDLVAVLQALRATQPGQAAPLPAEVLAKAVTAIDRALVAGRTFEAVTLLRMIRDQQICRPEFVELSRRAGRLPQSTPIARVDMLSYRLTCASGAADQAFWDDLERLVDASEQLADQVATHRVHSSAVRFLVAHQEWARLGELVQRPGFVRVMQGAGAQGAATAQVLQLGATVLAGQKLDLVPTQQAYEAACITFGNRGREALCRELGTLRNRLGTEPAAKLKDDALRLVRAVSQ